MAWAILFALGIIAVLLVEIKNELEAIGSRSRSSPVSESSPVSLGSIEISLDSIERSIGSIETWLRTHSIEVNLQHNLDEIVGSLSEIAINTAQSS